MTPLEASTTVLLHCEDFNDSSAHKIVGVQTNVSVPAAASTSQAKFGSKSIDAYNLSARSGVKFTGVGSQRSNVPMAMECWVYLRSSSPGQTLTLIGSWQGLNTTAFTLLLDSGGHIVIHLRDSGGNSNDVRDPSAIATGQWVHLVAAVDDNRVIRLFANGTLVAVGGTVTTLTAAAYDFIVGGTGASGVPAIDGYIDEVRYVYGIDPYTVPYVIQSAAFPDSSPSDPNFSSVSLLLHGEGSNGGTTITDSSSNALTPSQIGSSGNVTTSTTKSRFGSASLRFGGTHGIGYSANAVFELASRDFTFECQLNADTGLSSGFRVIWQAGTASGDRVVLYWTPSDNALVVNVYSSGVYRGGAGVTGGVTPGIWQSISLTKEGAVWTIWIDGVPLTAFTNSLSPTGNLGFYVGKENFVGVSTDYFVGYIDELRFTAGVARYSLNFTPPTSAYADIDRPSGASKASAITAKPGTALTATPKAGYGPIQIKDVYDGGKGYITGSVKEKVTPPPSIARHERVRLIRERDGRCIRETWSDATTGAFTFANIDETLRYTVVAYDHTNTLRAVIGDNILPST